MTSLLETRVGGSRRALRVAAVVGSLALMLGACSSGDAATSSSAGTSSAGSPSSGDSPLTVNPSELKATVDRIAKELQTPGAVALVQSPAGNFETTFGTSTLGGDTPISMGDHERIGSVTKTFTGTVILQLVKEGKLALADPVSKYWPGVPNGDQITIEQLLNMRSGLFNYSEELSLNESLDKTPGRIWTPEELLAMGLARPPYFPPGSGYHYSNTNTVLLGLIAQKLDGKPLPRVFADRIFTPLGLTQTSFPPNDTTAIPSPYVTGYMFGTNVETMNSAVLPPAQQAAAKAGTLKPNDVSDQNPSWAWAAGQLISNAQDLAIWAKELGEGSLLTPELQQQRLDSLAPIDPKNPDSPGYGLGLARFGPVVGHSGEMPGYNTFVAYDPVNKLAIVVWANLNAGANGDSVANTIARAMIEQIYAPKASATAKASQ